MTAAPSEEEVADILRADHSVRFTQGKSAALLAGLIERVGN